jgi:hypothetical protein
MITFLPARAQQKRTMLENAVALIDDLCQIKGKNADLEMIKTGRALKFSEYTSLLISAAIGHNEAYKPKLAKCLAYAHDITTPRTISTGMIPRTTVLTFLFTSYRLSMLINVHLALGLTRMAENRTSALACHLTVGQMGTEERAPWDQL